MCEEDKNKEARMAVGEGALTTMELSEAKTVILSKSQVIISNFKFNLIFFYFYFHLACLGLSSRSG